MPTAHSPAKGTPSSAVMFAAISAEVMTEHELARWRLATLAGSAPER